MPRKNRTPMWRQKVDEDGRMVEVSVHLRHPHLVAARIGRGPFLSERDLRRMLTAIKRVKALAVAAGIENVEEEGGNV